MSARGGSVTSPRSMHMEGVPGNESPRNRHSPTRLTSRSRQGAAAQSSAKPIEQDEGMVVVWDGPRPRLMRRLHMSTAAPKPDFEAASSRARSTAMRLGMPGAQKYAESEQKGSPRVMMSSARSSMSSARATESAAARSPRAKTSWCKPGSETWAGDADYLDQLSSKVTAVQRFIARQGPDQARAATVDLGAVWRMPSMTVDPPRLHMQSKFLALTSWSRPAASLQSPSHLTTLSYRRLTVSRWLSSPRSAQRGFGESASR